MPEVIYNILLYLLAVYGALTLITGILSCVNNSISDKNDKLRLVLIVKNQQDIIESLVRNILSGNFLRKTVPGGKFTILDMASSDDTAAILERLKEDYQYLEVIHENEKEKIFSDF